MPDSPEKQAELIEAARVMAAPDKAFTRFMAEAIEAAEAFQADAEARKTQNEP